MLFKICMLSAIYIPLMLIDFQFTRFFRSSLFVIYVYIIEGLDGLKKMCIRDRVQVTIRSDASWDDRMKIDIQYVNKFSVLFDIRILFGTGKTVLKGEAI